MVAATLTWRGREGDQAVLEQRCESVLAAAEENHFPERKHYSFRPNNFNCLVPFILPNNAGFNAID